MHESGKLLQRLRGLTFIFWLAAESSTECLTIAADRLSQDILKNNRMKNDGLPSPSLCGILHRSVATAKKYRSKIFCSGLRHFLVGADALETEGIKEGGF